MHGGALLFMVVFWGLVISLVAFVFCRLYCPGTETQNTVLNQTKENFEEIDEVT